MKEIRQDKYISGYEIVGNKTKYIRGYVQSEFIDGNGYKAYNIVRDTNIGLDKNNTALVSEKYGPVKENIDRVVNWDNTYNYDEDIYHDKYYSTRGFKVGDKVKHFEGNEYYIIAFAKDYKTMENRVIYKDDKGNIWDREQIDFDGLALNKQNNVIKQVFKFEKV